MLKNVVLIVTLFMAGALGSLFPVILNRDGASLIIIGYGFGLMLIHTRIVEGHLNVKSPVSLKMLAVVITLISIASMGYSVYRRSTGYNKVMLVGITILEIWNTYQIFSALKKK